jgi:hypothetical protein
LSTEVGLLAEVLVQSLELVLLEAAVVVVAIKI